MFVSIVVPTHSLDNFQNLIDTVDSLLNQTHKEMEIIVVVDGNQELYERLVKVYDGQANIKTVGISENVGVSAARNAGIRAAKGDAIAFIDDDAVAETRWLENVVATHDKFDAVAVAGKILPVWVSGKPDYFPEELYWLVGVTEKGFAREEITEIRNAYAPNMSFKREVFDKIGLLNERLGFARRGTSYVQGSEAEFALRVGAELGQGVIYNPEAIVYHKIPPSKGKVGMILKRSFYQGYSKALLRSISSAPQPIATERAYLRDLLLKYIPQRMGKVFRGSDSIAELKNISILVASICAVGLGFIFEIVKLRLTPKRGLEEQ